MVREPNTASVEVLRSGALWIQNHSEQLLRLRATRGQRPLDPRMDCTELWHGGVDTRCDCGSGGDGDHFVLLHSAPGCIQVSRHTLVVDSALSRQRL